MSQCTGRKAKFRFCNNLGHVEQVCESETLGYVQLHVVPTTSRAKFLQVMVNGDEASFQADSGFKVGFHPACGWRAWWCQEPSSNNPRPIECYVHLEEWITVTNDLRLQTPSKYPLLLGFPAVQVLVLAKFLDTVFGLDQKMPL